MRPLPTRVVLGGAFVLRPLAKADAADWLALVTNPQVYGPTSWAVTELEVMRTTAARHATFGRRWAVVRAADGAFVGTCGAARVEGEPEVAYELAPAVWGQGLAGAAVAAFVEESFADGIPRLVAHTWVENHASARVLKRCGFTREERLPTFRNCRGEDRDFWRWGRVADR